MFPNKTRKHNNLFSISDAMPRIASNNNSNIHQFNSAQLWFSKISLVYFFAILEPYKIHQDTKIIFIQNIETQMYNEFGENRNFTWIGKVRMYIVVVIIINIIIIIINSHHQSSLSKNIICHIITNLY